MNKKTFFLVIGIIGGVLLTSLLYFAFMFFVAFGGLNFLIPVPKPEVTHGEFPFQLTYEKKMMDDRYLGYTQWENGVQTGCSIPKEEVW